jgi:hypothetical protein
MYPRRMPKSAINKVWFIYGVFSESVKSARFNPTNPNPSVFFRMFISQSH